MKPAVLLIICVLFLNDEAFSQRSKTKKDGWGNETTTYYNHYGAVAGTSTSKTDFWGKKTTVYKDGYGCASGRSISRTGVFGKEKTEYYDRNGSKTGSSVKTPGILNETIEFKDQYGSPIGTGKIRKGGLGTVNSTYSTDGCPPVGSSRKK